MDKTARAIFESVFVRAFRKMFFGVRVPACS